jgi:hypothetical protein
MREQVNQALSLVDRATSTATVGATMLTEHMKAHNCSPKSMHG